mgnify:FL=1|tara:strand:+ start:8968 stop:9894 length:927 start_codon:yes stop_codon:yes gene_type:complete
MGFLDNSGDIILDAVLTDLGRKRLAEGNGRFNISKFALGDDEIDYGLYDKTHASGSAYYDLNILQTPVLESFTNNMSSMKSRLLSYARNDLLYLPVILANTTAGGQPFFSGLNSYIILVDQTTVDTVSSTGQNALAAGVLNGFRPAQGANLIEADQGLDTTELSNEVSLAAEDDTLVETQYFVQIDNRLGQLRSAAGDASYSPSSIDDDNIATYIFSSNDDTGAVSDLNPAAASILRGPRGSRVQLKVASSLDLKTSSFLFTQLGSPGVSAIGDLAAANYRFIDSTVRISGVSTGYTLDVPVRFVKQN